MFLRCGPRSSYPPWCRHRPLRHRFPYGCTRRHSGTAGGSSPRLRLLSLQLRSRALPSRGRVLRCRYRRECSIRYRRSAVWHRYRVWKLICRLFRWSFPRCRIQPLHSKESSPNRCSHSVWFHCWAQRLFCLSWALRNRHPLRAYWGIRACPPASRESRTDRYLPHSWWPPLGRYAGRRKCSPSWRYWRRYWCDWLHPLRFFPPVTNRSLPRRIPFLRSIRYWREQHRYCIGFAPYNQW